MAKSSSNDQLAENTQQTLTQEDLLDQRLPEDKAVETSGSEPIANTNLNQSLQGKSQDKTLTKQAMQGFMWSGLSVGIQGVLQFACFTTLAHLLGPKEFGIVGMATIFTNFIERVGFCGVGQAVVQREDLTPAHIRCANILCIAFGFFFFGVFYLASPYVAEFFNEPKLETVLHIVSLSFVLACIAEVPMSLLQRELRFKELLITTNSGYLIGNGVVGITMALLGFSYWSLVAAIVVGRVVRLFVALKMKPQRISFNFSIKEVKDLLGIGFGFSLGRITSYWALVGDNFVTGKLLGAQTLGLYSRAYQLMTAPAVYFGQILDKVLFAALSQRQREPEKIGVYYLYGIELCSLVSIGGAVMLSLAAPEIVTVLFGKQWLEAVPAVQILAFGVFFRTCYKNSDTVIRALGAVYRLATRQAIYLLLVVGGSIFGSRWGLQGVASAVLFAVFANYALLSYLCFRLLPITWKQFLASHLPAVWVGAWQILAVQQVVELGRKTNSNSFLILVIGGLTLCIATVAALWFSPRICRPSVFTWLTKNFNFKRLGPIGKLAKEFLSRGAVAAR